MITTTCFIWTRRNSALNECRKTFSQTLKWSIFLCWLMFGTKESPYERSLHLIIINKKVCVCIHYQYAKQGFWECCVCPKKKKMWNYTKQKIYKVTFQSTDFLVDFIFKSIFKLVIYDSQISQDFSNKNSWKVKGLYMIRFSRFSNSCKWSRQNGQ